MYLKECIRNERIFGEGDSKTSAGESVDRLLSCNLASLIRLWINSLRIQMSGDSLILGSLSDCVLGLELFIELPQCLLFTDEIIAVESRQLPITI